MIISKSDSWGKLDSQMPKVPIQLILYGFNDWEALQGPSWQSVFFWIDWRIEICKLDFFKGGLGILRLDWFVIESICMSLYYGNRGCGVFKGGVQN